MASQAHRRHRRPTAVAAAVRLTLLTLVWGALTEGEAFWPWGLGAAAVLTAASLTLVRPQPGRLLSTLRLLRLLPQFARDSLAGGWDVARRALSPELPVRPALETVPLHHPGIPLAVALAYAITLMPGTLAVEVRRRSLQVHVLDHRLDNRGAILALERRLADAQGGRLR